MAKVDLPVFKKELEKILALTPVQSKYRTSEHTDKHQRHIYSLQSDNFIYEVTLGDKWIGYELHIIGGKDLLGAGTSVDTDLYPIYGSLHEEIAAEIFHEGMHLLRQILSGEVLYSLSIKESVLAIKIDGKKYSVKKSKKGFLGFYSSVTKDVPTKEVKEMDLQRLF